MENRIIKFRAWNNIEMIYFDEIKKWLVENLVSGENLIISQFTNNYDKNGKEIYHGDILQNEIYKYEVHCYSGNFCIFIGEETVYLTDAICKNYEVIENVFENSELVETPIDMSVFNQK